MKKEKIELAEGKKEKKTIKNRERMAKKKTLA